MFDYMMYLLLISTPSFVVVSAISLLVFYLDKKRGGWGAVPLTIWFGTLMSSTLSGAIAIISIAPGAGANYGNALILLVVLLLVAALASLIMTPIIYKYVKRLIKKPRAIPVYLVISAIAFIYLTSAPNYLGRPAFSLYGKVIDYRTNEPLANVEIRVHSLYEGGFNLETSSPIMFATNNDGVFQINGYAESVSLHFGGRNNYEGLVHLVLHEKADKYDYEIRRYNCMCDINILKESALESRLMHSAEAERYTKKNPMIVKACYIGNKRPPVYECKNK